MFFFSTVVAFLDRSSSYKVTEEMNYLYFTDTLNKILSATIFKYMTKLSYCVYLTHMGLLLFNAGVLQVPLQVHMFLNVSIVPLKKQ